MVMKLTPEDPPREFTSGVRNDVVMRDTGRLDLATDEQVTLTTEAGGEYDVARKEWGFYATPSLNWRLPRFGLRGALVRNSKGHAFVMLVERGREACFEEYVASEMLRVVGWLDDNETLDRIDRALR
jgi:hypothetical protein